jgi:hypothetical protein
VETVRVEAESSQLVGALERVLPRHGYRTQRSFDMSMSTSTKTAGRCVYHECPDRCPEGCACRYTVLLVQSLVRTGMGQTETIAVYGKGGSSTLTLLACDTNSELAAQFAPLLTEALRISAGAERNDDAVDKSDA